MMKQYPLRPKKPDLHTCECGHDRTEHGQKNVLLFTILLGEQCEVCMCPNFKSEVDATRQSSEKVE